MKTLFCLMALMTISSSAFASEFFTTHNCTSGEGNSKSTVTIERNRDSELRLTISLPTESGSVEVSGPATMSNEDGVESYVLDSGLGEVQVITSFGISEAGTRLGFVLGGSVLLGGNDSVAVPRLSCH